MEKEGNFSFFVKQNIMLIFFLMLCLVVIVTLFFSRCSTKKQEQLLVVGGTHILNNSETCKFIGAEPKTAIKKLDWEGNLAIEASDEGVAEIQCGTERKVLRFVKAARITIEINIGSSVDKELHIGDRFSVKAHLYDSSGRELEVAKFTEFVWASSPNFETLNNRSSGEFGFCDTCFGMHPFHVLQQGQGFIEVHFGSLQEIIEVTVKH